MQNEPHHFSVVEANAVRLHSVQYSIMKTWEKYGGSDLIVKKGKLVKFLQNIFYNRNKHIQSLVYPQTFCCLGKYLATLADTLKVAH